jgi:hypothetical protein
MLGSFKYNPFQTSTINAQKLKGTYVKHVKENKSITNIRVVLYTQFIDIRSSKHSE